MCLSATYIAICMDTHVIFEKLCCNFAAMISLKIVEWRKKLQCQAILENFKAPGRLTANHMCPNTTQLVVQNSKSY